MTTMNRRSFFRTFAAAMCAAAIEVTGVFPEVPDAEMFKNAFVKTVISLWENDPIEFYFKNGTLKSNA